jgi:hypothetical protein
MWRHLTGITKKHLFCFTVTMFHDRIGVLFLQQLNMDLIKVRMRLMLTKKGKESSEVFHFLGQYMTR